MISKPSLTIEIASALVHEADSKELEEIMKLVEEERNEKLGKSEIKQAKNWAQSLALFEHYLKTKLESIAFGLRDVKEEFLADILVKDAEGRERTIVEVIEPALESAGVKFPQLTAPRGEGAK